MVDRQRRQRRFRRHQPGRRQRWEGRTDRQRRHGRCGRRHDDDRRRRHQRWSGRVTATPGTRRCRRLRRSRCRSGRGRAPAVPAAMTATAGCSTVSATLAGPAGSAETRRPSVPQSESSGRGQRDRWRRWRGRVDRQRRRRRDRGCRRTEQFDRPESGRCWRHEVRFSAPDDAFLSTAHGEKLATSPCTSTAAWNSKPISVPSRRSWTSRPPTLGQAPRSERRHGSRALSRMGPLRRRPRPPRSRARLSQRLHPARAGHLMTKGPISRDQSHCLPIIADLGRSGPRFVDSGALMTEFMRNSDAFTWAMESDPTAAVDCGIRRATGAVPGLGRGARAIRPDKPETADVSATRGAVPAAGPAPVGARCGLRPRLPHAASGRLGVRHFRRGARDGPVGRDAGFRPGQGALGDHRDRWPGEWRRSHDLQVPPRPHRRNRRRPDRDEPV